MKDYKKDMGLRIKTRRKALRLTQETVAERLDVSVKHFSEVERGLTGLSIENLVKLSGVLMVSLDYLVKGEEEQNPWQATLTALCRVPPEQETRMRELIRIGIEMTQK